jgi:hypothetical protein
VDAIAMLRNRNAAVTASLLDAIGPLDGVDLVRPVAPATSPLGLTLWHVPRTQDWLVQASVRGVPEVAEGFVGGLPDPEAYGFGTGLSEQQAAAAAAAVDTNRLPAYAVAVRDAVDAWLASLSDADLDAVPPFAARQQVRSAYSTPGALRAVDSPDGLSTGVLLLRPATTHLFRHLGEVDALLSIARPSVPTA